MKKTLTRRKFVGTIAAGTGAILAGSMMSTELTAAPGKTGSSFKTISLGNTGIKTTLLGMGTGFNGGNRSSAITRAGNAESMIRFAYESGIRFFDCADTYGTHPYVSRALKDIPREKYTLSSKIWMTSGGIPEKERPDADLVLDRFRKELNTDFLDIVQIHCMTSGNWTEEQKKQMDILENLKAKKIIRAHGVSVHSLEALEAAAKSDWVDIIHVRINPFGAAMDAKDPSLVVPVIKRLHDSGKGVIGMKLIGNGSFSNDSAKVDQSIRFVLGLRTVDMVIVGFEKPEQISNYVMRIDSAFEVLDKKQEKR
jgi:predicted aldo/keto reductase-like oxidoreductase